MQRGGAGERRLLQVAIAVFGLVPVAAGLAGCFFGPEIFSHGISVGRDLDSHGRYLSGLLAGVGLSFWGCIPAIEREGSRIRLLAAIVVVGGLARLYGVLVQGLPETGMIAALVMELGVTPALALWQMRIERQGTTADDGSASG